MSPGDFDGFITPSGKLISIDDVDQMLSVLSQRTENTDEIVQALWGLAGECADVGKFAAACPVMPPRSPWLRSVCLEALRDFC